MRSAFQPVIFSIAGFQTVTMPWWSIPMIALVKLDKVIQTFFYVYVADPQFKDIANRKQEICLR
jgi:hypothetical protein